jgi:hypothetical protein
MFDPEFCEKRCPVCTRARKGHRLARLFQTVETLLTFGGCPWGRARKRKYGMSPYCLLLRLPACCPHFLEKKRAPPRMRTAVPWKGLVIIETGDLP